jgi:hypothetical protein
MAYPVRRLIGATVAGAALFGSIALGGCGGTTPKLAAPAAPLTPPVTLCTERAPNVDCNGAREIEAWLSDPRLAVLGSGPTPAGTQGAKVLTVAIPERDGQRVFRAKWRPLSSESLTNDPRKELGAYAVAKLFLEPYEYVVPPTAGHCFDLARYRAVVDRAAEPSFPQRGTSCVFGFLSYWLENVGNAGDARKAGVWSEEDIFDEKLFRANHEYGKAISDLNILTYLIRHGDAHEYQFMITEDRRTPRAYSVDNSIAFRSIKNPMLLFRKDWSAIQVPAISRQSAERLSALDEHAWATLAVIEQYFVVKDKLLPMQAKGLTGSPDDGLRWAGLSFQVGLTDAEISGVRDRLTSLLKDVESGRLKTF